MTTIVDRSENLPSCYLTDQAPEELAAQECFLIVAKPPGAPRGKVVLHAELSRFLVVAGDRRTGFPAHIVNMVAEGDPLEPHPPAFVLPDERGAAAVVTFLSALCPDVVFGWVRSTRGDVAANVAAWLQKNQPSSAAGLEPERGPRS